MHARPVRDECSAVMGRTRSGVPRWEREWEWEWGVGVGLGVEKMAAGDRAGCQARHGTLWPTSKTRL